MCLLTLFGIEDQDILKFYQSGAGSQGELADAWAALDEIVCEGASIHLESDVAIAGGSGLKRAANTFISTLD